MPNPEYNRHFLNAVWHEAFDDYEKDCGGKLWEAPQSVQDEYKLTARKKLRDWLFDGGTI